MVSLRILLKEAGEIARQSSFLIHSLFNGEERPFNHSLDLVIGLHGYTARSFTLYGIGSHLENSGLNVCLVNYDFWQPNERIAATLQEKLDQLAQKREKKMSLLGHSQGGLLAIDIAKQRPDLIQKVVALGPPLRGTDTAYLNYPIPSCQEMIPNNPYCQRLLEGDFPREVLFTSIYTSSDQVIRPWQNALLPERQGNIKNIAAPPVGHLGLIGPRCYTLVEKVLKE